MTKTWKVKINLDVEIVIKAEKCSDAEQSAVSRLIRNVLNEGIVETMNPRSIVSHEVPNV